MADGLPHDERTFLADHAAAAAANASALNGTATLGGNGTAVYEQPDPEEIQHAVMAFYLVVSAGLLCFSCSPCSGSQLPGSAARHSCTRCHGRNLPQPTCLTAPLPTCPAGTFPPTSCLTAPPACSPRLRRSCLSCSSRKALWCAGGSGTSAGAARSLRCREVPSQNTVQRQRPSKFR